MKYTLKIVFGKEQVIKVYNNELLTEEESENNLKEYSFTSIEEKNAFIRGVNEAIGWTECCMPEFELCTPN